MESNSLTQVPLLSFAPTRINMSTEASISNEEHVIEENRNVRARINRNHGLLPYDRSVVMPDGLISVDLEHMMKEKPERKRSVMYLQLLRVVSGSSNNGQSNTSVYQSYFRKNKREMSREAHFIRLFLFRDVSSKDGQVVYIVENKNLNDKLWNRFAILRDNGVVTIGSYITILNPLPITNFFYNEVPSIETRGGCIVNRKPHVVNEIHIDSAITNDTTCSFVLNKMDITVDSTDVQNTKCGGLFCDRQRTIEINRGNKACGCYAMSSHVANIVLVHTISVKYQDTHATIFTMDDFSSLKFSDIYLKNPFSSSVKFNQLDMITPAYHSLVNCVDDVIDYINLNGGFTLIGWYRRGEIKDISSDEVVHHVDASDIGYKIVSIYPTNNLLDNNALDLLKFDFNRFVGSSE